MRMDVTSKVVRAGVLAWLALSCAWAQSPAADATTDLQALLARMHEAGRSRAYVGTFVVSSGTHLSSARIWHACEGPTQVERVESLTGAPRSVFRHNDRVLTVWPGTGQVRMERRESLGLFPDRLRTADARLAEHYTLQASGQIDRVAGAATELVQLQPRDAMRFGYRIWLERQSGLVLKLQTLDRRGQVLEQAAFSELELDAPLKVEPLLRMMARLEAEHAPKPAPARTTLAAEGWSLRQEVPGFKALGCQRRTAASGAAAGLHCVFSDGLASVSVFLEAAPGALASETTAAMGATHTLRTQVRQHAATFVGEVPAATLKRFAQALERRPSNP